MDQILNQLIKEELAPIFRIDGFKGSVRNYRRLRGELIHIINIQSSTWGGEFAINLGVHLSFLPTVSGSIVEYFKLKEFDCEFRRRMSKTDNDQWWKYDQDEKSIMSAVLEAKQTYLDNGRKQLNYFGEYPKDFSHITIEKIATGRKMIGGFRNTPRLALVLARIRVYEHNNEEAKKFIEYGLKNIGNAKMLENSFIELLSSIS